MPDRSAGCDQPRSSCRIGLTLIERPSRVMPLGTDDVACGDAATIRTLMHLDQLRRCLESLERSPHALARLGPARRRARPAQPARTWPTRSAWTRCASSCHPLGRLLPRCPDPDMALNNLERFLANPAGGRQLPAPARRPGPDARNAPAALQHQPVLQRPARRQSRLPRHAPRPAAQQPEPGGAARAAAGARSTPPSRTRPCCAPFAASASGRCCASAPTTSSAIGRSKRSRATSRASPTPPSKSPWPTALRNVGKRFGEPVTDAGEPARCVILAFGKLGGEELNYSSDIDLMFVYDEEGETRGKRTASIGNDEFFARVVSEVVRLLSRPHRPRPGLSRRSAAAARRPARPAGPLAGQHAVLLRHAGPHLGAAGAHQGPARRRRPRAGRGVPAGDRAVRLPQVPQRRRDQRDQGAQADASSSKTGQAGESDTEVKTGRGGIRDIEFTIQFLQLLNGGDLPEVRQRNTLLALQALEKVGCLTDQEYRVLDDAYRFLRKTEHRLQLLFDLQTHRLPDTRRGAAQAGAAHGLRAADGATDCEPPRTPAAAAVASAALVATRDALDPLDAFLHDYRDKTDAQPHDPRPPAAPDVPAARTARPSRKPT